MSNLLPYSVCYSSKSRGKCKRCKKNIDRGCIEIGILVQSNKDDCHILEWHHVACFFKNLQPSTEAAFDGFSKLRYADQLQMRAHIGSMENGDNQNVLNQSTNQKMFGIGYTKSRDNCAECEQEIIKPSIRIMYVVSDENRNAKAVWYHPQCFARARSQLGWLQSAENLPGFRKLAEEDKTLMLNQIPLIRREIHRPIERISIQQRDVLDKLIEAQNKEYYEMYDKVKCISAEDRALILQSEGQFVPDSEFDILHHLVDVLCFGALYPCDACNNAGLVFSNTAYICCHMGTWSKCGFEIKEPKRREVYICREFRIKYSFLTSKCRARTRALHVFRTHDENGQDLVYGSHRHSILFNMEFAVIGNLAKQRSVIEKAIEDLGGTVVDVIHKKLAAVISNAEEVIRMGVEMKDASKHKIQVVSLDFLEKVQTIDPIQYISQESICTWGGNAHRRITQINYEPHVDDDLYTRAVPEKVTYISKNNCVVDTECELEGNVQVYCQSKNGRIIQYSVVLGFVSIENNQNSYYRMQLLESNDPKSYWIFEAWGRISTTIGSKRTTNYDQLDVAIKKFKKIYKEKTGNSFTGSGRFVKHANKYYQHDIELGPEQPLEHTEPSQLNPSVYQLMSMLFDVNNLKNCMYKCELDLKQMPLGKLSADQIRCAMKTLDDLLRLISHQSVTIAQLRDASNKFYTLVPHGFNVNRPPIIDSLQVVRAKREMLEDLLNMELIYNYLDEETGKGNPLDACYLKLKTEITPLPSDTERFKQLRRIVANTQGPTHDNYTLELMEVFEIRRESEDLRFSTLENHRLLWHGSRQMNFVSILTKGLEIAPPEAPVNGYMFGKGIYFADMVSKSANYCRTDRENNIGLMLLCDVALGTTFDMRVAGPEISMMPDQFRQSVKGCGAIYPSQCIELDGVRISSGKLTNSRTPTALQYNEYVVYDPTQVKIKYLVKMKFHYKP